MSDAFASMLHAIVLRVAPPWCGKSERCIAALRGKGGRPRQCDELWREQA